MAEPTGVIASAVSKALSDDVVILVPTLHPVLRYPSIFLALVVWFWKGLIKFLINSAVPSTFVPTDTQRLKAAIAARERARKNTTSRASTSDTLFTARTLGLRPAASNDSLPTLINPGSPTYRSVPGDLTFGIVDINDSDDDFELPPLEYVPPTPEDLKRWVELSFEERRKVHNMSENGLNWMKWNTASQPLPLTRVRDVPKGIPEWWEQWSCYDLPENPRHVPTSGDLRRWWAEATEEDRARINRICFEGLNWRTWFPAPQPPCDENNVVLSGIGAFAELGDSLGDCPDDLFWHSTDLPTTAGTTQGNGSTERPAL